MNLDDIRPKETVVLDANIFVYAIFRVSAQCERLLSRCAGGDVAGVVPAHVLAEVMHQLMIAEAGDNGWIQSPNAARSLQRPPERVRGLVRYEEYMRDIPAVGLHIVGTTREDYLSAMHLQRRYGLLTNDALICAGAQRLRVASLASADIILRRVQDVVVFSPDDLEP